MQHSKWFPYLVLAAAGTTGLVVLGFPLVALLPFVFILACPLMMVVMMKGMGGMHGSTEDHRGHGCEHDPTRTGPDRWER